MYTPGDNQSDLNYLLQQDLISNLIPNIGKAAWQVVYNTINDAPPNRLTIFSALLEKRVVEGALKSENWDLMIDGSYGSGIRPLIIRRDFHGAWPTYLEVCEEFRHFHNLAEDHERKILLDFDESGYKIDVARITEHGDQHRVDVFWKYLREFLAATQLHLAIYFDSYRYSVIRMQNVPQKQRQLTCQGNMHRYARVIVDYEKHGYHTLSCLRGKVIVAPPPTQECGKWPFEEPRHRNEEDGSFIIGVDSYGREITAVPNPECHGSEPKYLRTLVYFRKEVLQKYYAASERYYVGDGCLRCHSLWELPIDNDHPTYVVVFLNHLSRAIPYRERLHWKQYNVPPPPPADAEMSRTFFQRSILGQFAEAESEDLVFRREYSRLNEAWRQKMGWPLFREPMEGDKYILQSVHIPVSDSQSELDEQVLGLAKLLIDSLNEEALAKASSRERHDGKGITKLEHFLESKGWEERGNMIQFMRDLQELRSVSVAHRKGNTYRKVLQRLGLAQRRQDEVMKVLLAKAVTALQACQEFVRQTDSE